MIVMISIKSVFVFEILTTLKVFQAKAVWAIGKRWQVRSTWSIAWVLR